MQISHLSDRLEVLSSRFKPSNETVTLTIVSPLLLTSFKFSCCWLWSRSLKALKRSRTIALIPKGAVGAPVSKLKRAVYISRHSPCCDLRYLPLSLRRETMRRSPGFSEEEIYVSRRVCFAVSPGKQHISHSFPVSHFLIGLQQLKSLCGRNSSLQLKFERIETKAWDSMHGGKQGVLPIE